MIQKRKFLSLGVCLVIVALIASLISGCAGDGPGPEPEPGDEEPIHGGELTLVTPADPATFDDAIGPHYTTRSTAECLWSGDWAKGPAGGYGTGEAAWRVVTNQLSHKTGYIAETYEIHDDYLIFNLRPGVKWHDKYPCNGREVTVDDVVYSLERQKTLDTAYLYKSYPDLAAIMDVYAVDEDTVRIDCPDHARMAELLTLIDFMYIYPQDVIELYGDMNHWERCIGTGPFTLEEYVESSYLYYERNPDYWGTNPVGPGEGDQLPYVDSIRWIIQADPATQDSLFTTGQLDLMTANTERAQALKDLPGVDYVKFSEGGLVLFMRLDQEGAPWTDVRVRQAMQLAINNQQMLDQLYDGDGELLYWPVFYCEEIADAYVPLEDLEDDIIEDILSDVDISVADLFGYDLELAQALMDAAGYGEGFQAQVDVYNYYINLDQLQVVVNMLADIGIELTINAVDYSTYTTTWALGTFPDMLYGGMAGVGTYFKGINWSGTSMFNTSNVDDETLNDYRDQMLAAYPDEAAVDQIHVEMIPYLLEQCYGIQTVSAYSYRMWRQWVKNYSGEGGIGYYKALSPGTYAYIWLDEDLKEDMGY